MSNICLPFYQFFFVFFILKVQSGTGALWRCRERVSARGDSSSSSSTPRGSAWLSWNQPGAKMWRGNREQCCVVAKLSSVSLGEKKTHSYTHSYTFSTAAFFLWKFTLTGKYSTFNFFFFFDVSPTSRLCSPCQKLSGEPRWEESGASLVFNDPTWRSNLLYGIVVNEGALF